MPRGATLVDGDHAVQVYEHDAHLGEVLASFVAAGLAEGDRTIVIATEPHRADLERRLADSGWDVAAARADGRYVPLDASATLNRIVVNGWPDDARFDDVVGRLIGEARDGGRRRVRAFGEMVGLLWASADRDAAVRLEELWNGLGARIPFALLCAYPLQVFGETHDGTFERMCERHSHVIPSEGYTALTDVDERLRFVTELQQKAVLARAESAARMAAEAELRRQQEEMADLFENAAVPIHFVGPDGTILRANRAELEMVGYDASEYVGRLITEFHADAATIDDMLRRLKSGEVLKDYPSQLRCKDGTVKDVLIDSNVFWRDGTFVHTRCITRDVTAVRIAEQAQRQLAALVESSDDAIVGKTLDGIVTSWNRGAERILGYRAEEMIGQPISRIIPPDRADDFQAIIGTIRRGERVDHYDTERIRKDGRRIYVSLTVSPIRDASGRIVGASKIARDVTERKAAEAERERLLAVAETARAQAEEASRTKDEFLSVVSHELRTPLASILGWTTVLKTGATGERAARAVHTIERSARMQAKLIEDLLDVSWIVSGRMRLDLRLLDLPAIVREAIDAISPTADAKGVRLHAEVEPSAGPLAGDRDRLHQVAWNLLSNAVKFTPRGGRIDVRLVRREEDVQLVVRDTGCGIAPEFLPFVFERFRQAHTVASRRTGGLGLGLAIVRHLVELHGGEVTADSDGPGHGAAFTVTLPLMRMTTDAEDVPQVLSGRRILLVEDDDESRAGITALLEAHGADVVAVASAVEARRALQIRHPDLLVSDIRLPGEDGYALIRDLRSLPTLRTLPAIAITGEDTEDEHRVAAAGYHLRLAKPVDPRLFITAAAQLAARAGTS